VKPTGASQFFTGGYATGHGRDFERGPSPPACLGPPALGPCLLDQRVIYRGGARANIGRGSRSAIGGTLPPRSLAVRPAPRWVKGPWTRLFKKQGQEKGKSAPPHARGPEAENRGFCRDGQVSRWAGTDRATPFAAGSAFSAYVAANIFPSRRPGSRPARTRGPHSTGPGRISPMPAGCLYRRGSKIRSPRTGSVALCRGSPGTPTAFRCGNRSQSMILAGQYVHGGAWDPSRASAGALRETTVYDSRERPAHERASFMDYCCALHGTTSSVSRWRPTHALGACGTNPWDAKGLGRGAGHDPARPQAIHERRGMDALDVASGSPLFAIAPRPGPDTGRVLRGPIAQPPPRGKKHAPSVSRRFFSYPRGTGGKSPMFR